MFIQAFAGGALGLLLGLLVGLSASPVVATVVGAIAGGLMLLLGYSGKTMDAGQSDQAMRASACRLSGFGICGTVALLSGLYVRTHSMFSPTIAQQIQELTATGYTSDESHAWVAYKSAGLQLRVAPATFNAAAGAASAKDPAHTVLFDSPTDVCLLFDPARADGTADQLNALKLSGSRFQPLAQYASTLDDAGRGALFSSLRPVLCGAP